MKVTKIWIFPERDAQHESYPILFFDETACASEITENTVVKGFCPVSHGKVITSIAIELHDGVPIRVHTTED